MNPIYPSDLTDQQWSRVSQVMPTPNPMGRPMTYSLRAIVNAILYVEQTGCKWPCLPKGFPSGDRSYGYFRRWKENGILRLIYAQLSRDRIERPTERGWTAAKRKQLKAEILEAILEIQDEDIYPSITLLDQRFPEASHHLIRAIRLELIDTGDIELRIHGSRPDQAFFGEKPAERAEIEATKAAIRQENHTRMIAARCKERYASAPYRIFRHPPV